jgi:hypothetical protein|tara:strand:+ start:1175 stop:1414 length:240 start_codon:yes stop_codon:yes gene_type:complete
MALTIPNAFVDATISEAAEVNGNFTAVKNFVDALQAGTNITAGAIQTAAIADGAITSIKLATPASGDASQIVLGVQIFS